MLQTNLAQAAGSPRQVIFSPPAENNIAGLTLDAAQTIWTAQAGEYILSVTIMGTLFGTPTGEIGFNVRVQGVESPVSSIFMSIPSQELQGSASGSWLANLTATGTIELIAYASVNAGAPQIMTRGSYHIVKVA